MAKTFTTAEFAAWFDNFYAQFDEDKCGEGLEKHEAEALARKLHSFKNDGSEFDVARAEKLWDEFQEGGKISKEKLHTKLFEKAKSQGRITDA